MAKKKKSLPESPRESVFPARLALALLAVIVFAVYFPALHGGFVYDSQPEIALWDFIHNPANLPTVLSFRVMTLDVVDFNRPVAIASFMIDSLFWGRSPFGYHLTNNLLHAAVACLAFLLIRHLLGPRNEGRDPAWRNFIALLATLIFALHPTVTEAVCEPANRKDILASLFGLAALLLAIHHDPAKPRGALLRGFLCVLLCLLAIGSKELGAAFPALLVLYWWIFRRGEPGRFWAGTIVGSAAVVVAFLIARFALEHHPSEIFRHPPVYPGGSLAAAMQIQPRILTAYLANLVWPFELCADYDGDSIRGILLVFALPVLAAVTALGAWWAWADRRARFAVGLIVLALLPVCNLVPIYHPMADRYLYLPLAGLAALAAVALDASWLAATQRRRVAVAAAMILLDCGLASITLQREQVWDNPIALWQDTLRRNPESFAANANLPECLMRAGRLPEARAASEAALKTRHATYAWIWFDYALELNRLGDRAGAENAARKAISLQPDMLDMDKMVRTLQCEPDLGAEFLQLVGAKPAKP